MIPMMPVIVAAVVQSSKPNHSTVEHAWGTFITSMEIFKFMIVANCLDVCFYYHSKFFHFYQNAKLVDSSVLFM